LAISCDARAITPTDPDVDARQRRVEPKRTQDRVRMGAGCQQSRRTFKGRLTLTGCEGAAAVRAHLSRQRNRWRTWLDLQLWREFSAANGAN
jgi:hypothetical protein